MLFPFLDLKAEYATMKDDIRAAVDRVLESQQFIMGPEVKQLEVEIAAFIGSAFAIGCASGSDALLLALMALGVDSGDEVITPPFTFVATGGSIARLKAKPVFVDIDREIYNLDVTRLEAAITSRTKARGSKCITRNRGVFTGRMPSHSRLRLGRVAGQRAISPKLTVASSEATSVTAITYEQAAGGDTLARITVFAPVSVFMPAAQISGDPVGSATLSAATGSLTGTITAHAGPLGRSGSIWLSSCALSRTTSTALSAV